MRHTQTYSAVVPMIGKPFLSRGDLTQQSVNLQVEHRTYASSCGAKDLRSSTAHRQSQCCSLYHATSGERTRKSSEARTIHSNFCIKETRMKKRQKREKDK